MEYFFNFEKFNYVKGKRFEGCILCELFKDAPAVEPTVVYKNRQCAVAVNLYPYNPGHLLVFPSRHVKDMRELANDEREAINLMIESSLDILDNLYKPAGYNVGCNMGLCAGASIEHLHWHIIPRYPNEIGIAELLGGKRVLVEDIAKTRERLIEAFGNWNSH